MKNIFSGTFEQVEEAISESLVKNALDTMENFGIGRALLFVVFFIGAGCYGLYGASWYMGNHMDEATVPLDPNNEFITFLSSIWYIHALALIMFITVILTLVYRGKNNIKGLLLQRYV